MLVCSQARFPSARGRTHTLTHWHMFKSTRTHTVPLLERAHTHTHWEGPQGCRKTRGHLWSLDQGENERDSERVREREQKSEIAGLSSIPSFTRHCSSLLIITAMCFSTNWQQSPCQSDPYMMTTQWSRGNKSWVQCKSA